MNASTRLPRILAATIVAALTSNIAVSNASDAPGPLQVRVKCIECIGRGYAL
jgi:hypothetical protein